MPLKNFSVINHPVRMRIFQALHAEELTINQPAKRLADVPKPSLYRHINQMVEAGVIEVRRTRLVNGIEERFFAAVNELTRRILTSPAAWSSSPTMCNSTAQAWYKT